MRLLIRLALALMPLAVAACSESAAPNGQSLVPALESIPFSLLGTGKIAFKRFTAEYDAVYVIDLSTQKISAILPNAASEGPVLSPDGSRIATMLSPSGASVLVRQWNVFVGSAAGTGFQQLTTIPPGPSQSAVGPPTWTTDGQRLLIERGAHLTLTPMLSEIRVNDGVEVRVLPLVGPSLCSSGFAYWPEERVAIANDGRIAYACREAGIIVLSPDGQRIATLAAPNAPVIIGGLSWSPDGSRLAFIEWATGGGLRTEMSLRVVGMDGSPPTTLVHKILPSGAGNPYSGANAEAVCWLSGVNRLLFTLPEDIALYTKLWVVNLDGSGLAQITTLPKSTDRSISCVP